MMPPPTGLPAARSNALGGMFDSIPQSPDPAAAVGTREAEAHPHA